MRPNLQVLKELWVEKLTTPANCCTVKPDEVPNNSMRSQDDHKK